MAKHVYVFETRDFSQNSVVADITTVESTGVMYELLSNGEKRILAKDVARRRPQIIAASFFLFSSDTALYLTRR